MEATLAPAFRLLLIVLLLLDIALGIGAVLGSVALLGWGSRMTFKSSSSPVLKSAWPLAFILLPGAAHLLYSLTQPTPPRFRMLALWVTVGLTGFMALTLVLVVLAEAAGISI